MGTELLFGFGHVTINRHQANHVFEKRHPIGMGFRDLDFDLAGGNTCQCRFEFVHRDAPGFRALDQKGHLFLGKFGVDRGQVDEAVKDVKFFHGAFREMNTDGGFEIDCLPVY